MGAKRGLSFFFLCDWRWLLLLLQAAQDADELLTLALVFRALLALGLAHEPPQHGRVPFGQSLGADATSLVHLPQRRCVLGRVP